MLRTTGLTGRRVSHTASAVWQPLDTGFEAHLALQVVERIAASIAPGPDIPSPVVPKKIDMTRVWPPRWSPDDVPSEKEGPTSARC